MMKPVLHAVLLVSLVSLLGVGCQKTVMDGSSDFEVKKYTVESGEISYKYSGMKEGVGSLVFDQWGLREVQETKISEELSGQEVHTIMHTSPEFITTIDAIAETGIQVENRLLKAIIEKPDGRHLTEIGIDILKDLGGVQVGTDTVAGYECDLWEVPEIQVTQCLYNGVLLSMGSDFGGVTFRVEAEKAEFGKAINPDLFTISEEIEVTQAKFPDEVGL